MGTLSTSDHLERLRRHFSEIENQLAAPATMADPKRLAALGREHRDVQATLALAEDLARAESRLAQAEQMVREESDESLRELATAEVEESRALVDALTKDFQFRLLPPDPHDDRNIILEIRAGTGGDEAALFAADLLRMYSRYAERRGWKIEMLSSTPSDLGGFREVICTLSGERAYSFLKWEGGTHRVQRVPQTEAQGRIHTSAATVAVLPEAEETDVEIKDADLRIDTMTASGPGGQGVNTTYSAVRIVHLPTGLIVQCQDERSQIKNKAKAMQVLRARLLEIQIAADEAQRSALRKGMVGSGDRSGRIRTYNFPQNRVTDHRIEHTVYSLDRVMEGALELVIDPLRDAELRERLEELSRAGS